MNRDRSDQPQRHEVTKINMRFRVFVSSWRIAGGTDPSRTGHEVSIFGPASAPLRDGERALFSAVAINFGGTESSLGVSPFAARTVGAPFRRERFDVVHVHEPLTPLLPWLAPRAATAPLIGTFHVHREDGHRFGARPKPAAVTAVGRALDRWFFAPSPFEIADGSFV
jgi:hypothetical protein